jgi:hypothetical protein
VPFRSRPGQPRDLLAQISDEMRERIREAADHVALEVMVEIRKAQGRPGPAADSPGDRAEFEAGVRAFLERLASELTADLAAEERRKLAGSPASSDAPVDRLLATHVALARALPDYWQRFDALRVVHVADRSRSGGGEGRGMLRRLFGG